MQTQYARMVPTQCRTPGVHQRGCPLPCTPALATAGSVHPKQQYSPQAGVVLACEHVQAHAISLHRIKTRASMAGTDTLSIPKSGTGRAQSVYCQHKQLLAPQHSPATSPAPTASNGTVAPVVPSRRCTALTVSAFSPGSRLYRHTVLQLSGSTSRTCNAIMQGGGGGEVAMRRTNGSAAEQPVSLTKQHSCCGEQTLWPAARLIVLQQVDTRAGDGGASVPHLVPVHGASHFCCRLCQCVGIGGVRVSIGVLVLGEEGAVGHLNTRTGSTAACSAPPARLGYMALATASTWHSVATLEWTLR